MTSHVKRTWHNPVAYYGLQSFLRVHIVTAISYSFLLVSNTMAKSSSQAGSSPYSEYISRAEDVADQILRNSKHVLPHFARFCLISTFFEDGFRMWFQWDEQRDYMDQTWHCGYVLGTLFVLYNLVSQLGGCIMVLSRQKVEIAVGMLSSVIVVQVSLSSSLYHLCFYIFFHPCRPLFYFFYNMFDQ